MTRKCISVMLAGFLSLAAIASAADPELRGTPGELSDYLRSDSRFVTLTDNATEKALTDRAILELAVTTENRSLAAALDANRTLRAGIMAALQQAGIPAASIRTSEFSTSPDYGFFSSKASSFKVANAVSVTVTNEDQFRAAAGLVDRYKEVQLTGTSFEHSAKDKTVERVRKAALDKVMASRRFFEGELGLKLRPVSFNSSGNDGVSATEEIVVTARNKSVPLAVSALSVPEGFEEIEYRATVSVTFEVTRGDGK